MRKRPGHHSLVSQFLERVSRNALKEYQDVIREFVRRRHGLYALYRNDKLYYVGLASNLRNRLKAHLKNRHSDSWDRRVSHHRSRANQRTGIARTQDRKAGR
jgi:hypothetical protein